MLVNTPLGILICAFIAANSGWCAPVLLSSSNARSVSGSADSSVPQFSADGSNVVFISMAKDLVPNDDLSRNLDIFIRNLASSNTVLVSVNTNGIGGGNADANYACVSSNGNIVVFVSAASNLVAADTNNANDVFWRNISEGRTYLASATADGIPPIDPIPFFDGLLSGNPLVTAAGDFVFFESRATNLTTTPDQNMQKDIFRRELGSTTIVPVTLNATGNAMAAGRSALHDISSDGRFVLFSSTALDIHPGARTNSLYLRDMDAEQIIWAGINYTNIALPTLSEDGHFIAFISLRNSPLTGRPEKFGDVVRVDAGSGTAEAIGLATNLPSSLKMSADGQTIAYTSATDSKLGIWRAGSGTTFPDYGIPAAVSADGTTVLAAAFDAYPLQGGTGVSIGGMSTWFELIQTNGPGVLVYTDTLSDGFSAGMTRDGTRVVFESPSPRLVSGDFNGSSDVFLWNLDGTRELLSLAHLDHQSMTPAATAVLYPASISGDGRFVVSTRLDDPAVSGDTNRQADVFLTETTSGATIALSSLRYVTTNLVHGGLTTNLVLATNGCIMPVLSADGSTVAALRPTQPGMFRNFDVAITRATNGIFTPGMRVVARSRDSFGQSCFSPSLSGDGRLLAFASTIQNLTAQPDVNGMAMDVFINFERDDGSTNQTFLISRSTNSTTGNFGSTNPVISVDGRWVSFLSRASTLAYAALPRSNAVYPPIQTWPYDAPQLLAADLGVDRASTNFLQQFPIRLCSYTIETNRAPETFPEPGMSFTTLRPLTNAIQHHVFSGNGRYVFFGLSNAAAIFRHDLYGSRTNWFEERVQVGDNQVLQLTSAVEPGAENLLVCTNCSTPSVNADGTLVAFERTRAGTRITDIFTVDLTGGTEEVITETPSGSFANGSSTRPAISADGRYVVFQSKATDLVPNDSNRFTDIFVRDRTLGHTILVSANPDAVSGNGPSTSPVLAANGRTIVFHTSASDLIARDFNNKRDLMVLTLPNDAEGEGELEFKGNAVATGSAVRVSVMALARVGQESRLLMWGGEPTARYRIEYKDNLNETSWRVLDAPITWSGETARVTDSAVITNRFYRVQRIP